MPDFPTIRPKDLVEGVVDESSSSKAKDADAADFEQLPPELEREILTWTAPQGVLAYSRLNQHTRDLVKGDRTLEPAVSEARAENQRIGNLQNTTSESARANQIAAATENWENLLDPQRNALLNNACSISDAHARATALRSIGRRHLSAPQQLKWAAAVSELPETQQFSVIMESDVESLHSDTRAQLRGSVNSWRNGTFKRQALAKLN